MKLARILTLAITSTIMIPQFAFAHVGLGDAHGALHGFSHPLMGIDHLLAMVSVGLLAVNLGGRAIWAVPASFVVMMVLGGVLGITGFVLPLTEFGIGVSLLVLGMLITMAVRVPVSIAMTLAAASAIFHGFAHGAEMPENTTGFMFAAGFVIATALLHIFGILLGLGIARFSRAASQRMLKVAGGVAALVGVALVSGIV